MSYLLSCVLQLSIQQPPFLLQSLQICWPCLIRQVCFGSFEFLAVRLAPFSFPCCAVLSWPFRTALGSCCAFFATDFLTAAACSNMRGVVCRFWLLSPCMCLVNLTSPMQCMLCTLCCLKRWRRPCSARFLPMRSCFTSTIQGHSSGMTVPEIHSSLSRTHRSGLGGSFS